MSNSKVLALAAVVASVVTLQPARAADMPMPYIPAPVVEEYGGWYLRGYIGMSNQQFRGLDHISFASATAFEWLDSGGFSSAPLFGLGIGYQYNSWIRFDVTAEYRGGSVFKALDRFVNAGAFNTNDYTGIKKEWLFLANAFVDLGTWRSITPYLGVGAGFANVTISNFRDTNVIAGGGGWADTGSQWNFAWALYAGLAYKVTPTFSVDLGYRFVSLGDGKTGTLVNLDPTVPCATTCQPMFFRGIYSHDVMLGVRWMLDDGGYVPPLIRKG